MATGLRRDNEMPGIAGEMCAGRAARAAAPITAIVQRRADMLAKTSGEMRCRKFALQNRNTTFIEPIIKCNTPPLSCAFG
jgi:hypothetical protein